MELTAAEARVLGCLIELEAAAPEAVPVTLNTLRLACNQPTGRVPVVAYDDRTVEDTLLVLKSRGLARFVPPTTQARTTRYRHRADERWRMGPLELAVLAVLLLRGVQTVGEVRSQVQRLVPLTGPGEVDAVLDTLAARTPRPFAARVRGRGHEGPPRWVEVLTAPAPDGGDARAGDPPGNGGPARAGAAPRPVPAELASAPYADLAARVSELEQRLDASLERAPVAGDWPTPAFPPPPPPVGLGPVGAPGLPAGDRSEGAPGRGDLAQLADRLRDIERRLARIEAELGALR